MTFVLAVTLGVWFVAQWFTFLSCLLGKVNSGKKMTGKYVLASFLISMIWFVALPHSIYMAIKERKSAHRDL